MILLNNFLVVLLLGTKLKIVLRKTFLVLLVVNNNVLVLFAFLLQNFTLLLRMSLLAFPILHLLVKLKNLLLFLKKNI